MNSLDCWLPRRDSSRRMHNPTAQKCAARCCAPHCTAPILSNDFMPTVLHNNILT
ncbi:hypothetical protein RHMOL_Rhmol06G0251400 [Rhododendron molle]|uniref:Uncharacterized protein n=1 Tax=Rhododendron molle TaxID=49168 RepID=A0ACC0NH48_RHOML|nr:hypothetical protein RHMOL_Rhmol06G0251400 [Rhododendron molle]